MRDNPGRFKTMDPSAIRSKFGSDYAAGERTFIMGIDRRFTTHFAERFDGMTVLETCTGAGFTTISLAKKAKHVFTVEIDPSTQEQAIANIRTAGLSSQVTFIAGSILDPAVLESIPLWDAVFIDPDWAVTGPGHIFRFIRSNTQPPADTVLQTLFRRTDNIALILPPLVDHGEFAHLPEHECEWLYMGESHELFCLYFGNLRNTVGKTEFRVAEKE